MSRSILFFLAAILLTLGACNKTKRNANRLMKAGDWKVTSLTLDGMQQPNLPMWSISDCEIYDEVCIAQWSSEEGSSTDFAWQFRDKGQIFEISRQEGSTEETPESLEVATQAYNYSGVYDVVEESKDKMRFRSSEAIGYEGQEVIIQIEQQ